MEQFTNKQQTVITDYVKRQLMDACEEFFVYSATHVLLSPEYYEIFKSGDEKKFMLVIANSEDKQTRSSFDNESKIPQSTYQKSIIGNTSYTIFRDKHWEYIFTRDEEDLNFIRLMLTKGDCVILELDELNQKLKS